MADHDGHTINVGPMTVCAHGNAHGSGFLLPASCGACEVDRLRAENAALAAALGDIAGITYSPAHNAYVAGECSRFDGHECYIADPDDPGEWCPVCVAEVAWSAWKMGVLR